MTEKKECVYFNSVLGVCDIDGSVDCPCENYEELVMSMTEKRYLNIIPSGIQDTETGKIIRGSKVGDLLNEQEETIQELYDFRLIYNALLFNEWSKHDTIEVYKSKKHSDGELCFDGEWFVVVAILPTGQITNHYHINYWDYFKIKEYPKVKDEFDGHTPIDVLNRLKNMVMWND